MMKTAAAAFAISTILVAAASCERPLKPDDVPPGAVRITGTVHFYDLEGGFWAIRGDDGVTYDPVNGLAPTFRRENLRVNAVARLRTDVVGIHMAGPIVEILEIKEL